MSLFVGTPLATYDICFVSCVLLVEQSVPEYNYYNIRSTIFLKHRTDWDNVHCAIRSFTWSTILKSADPLDAFDRDSGEVIGRVVLTTVLRCRSGNKKWFDASCWRVYDAKQTAYHACIEHAVQIIGVDLCLHVLRPCKHMQAHNRRSIMLQGSHIMNAPGILRSTSPVHISGGRHLKARSLL